MNRRNFLTALTGLAATLTLDPEKLLWRPSEKTIFIPGVSDDGMSLMIGDFIRIKMKACDRFDRMFDESFARQYMHEAGERAGQMIDRIIIADFTK